MSNQVTVQQEFGNTLKSFAMQKQSEIVAIFGNNQNKAERFASDLALLSMNDGLVKCNPQSVFSVALNVAQVGLSIIPQEKEAYIVPFKGAAQLQVGYIGWQKLAMQSGILIECELCYSCDEIHVTADSNGKHIDFKANIFEREDDSADWVNSNLTGAIVWINYTKLGITKSEFVSGKTLQKLKAQNQSVKAGKFSPWTVWAAEMFKAKAIKYVASKLPKDGDSKNLAIAAEYESKQEIQQQEKTIQPYPQDRLLQNMESWKGLILSGKQTVESIIDKVEANYYLNEEQKMQIAELAFVEAEYTEESA